MYTLKFLDQYLVDIALTLGYISNVLFNYDASINLKKSIDSKLDEIEKHPYFFSVHKWKKKHPYFDANRVVLNPNKIQTDYENIIVCKKTDKSTLNKVHQPYIKCGKVLDRESCFPNVFDCFGTTSSAKDEIQEIFGNRSVFSTPKPVKLIKEFTRATTKTNSIVMDFFAGSGTLGQAVTELNKEDGGNRSFILVSNNESNICRKVTKKRMELIGAPFKFLSD